MLRQTGTDFLQRIPHPRFEIERMKPMNEEETGNQFVPAKLIDHRLTGGPGFVNEFHQALKASALQLKEGFHEFASLSPRDFVGDGVDRANQLFNPGEASLKFPVVGFLHAFSPVSFAQEAPRTTISYRLSPNGATIMKPGGFSG
jgi:hypothetical protein